MQTSEVSFQGSQAAMLTGLLDLPDDGVALRACAVFAHCFTCSKDLRVVRGVARELTKEGIAVLRFDFTGLGHSEGDFADTTFSTNAGDLEAASAWLAENYQAPKLLIGHSLGGAAVLLAAGDLPSVEAVATIGAPCDPGHVKHLLTGAQFDEEDRAEVVLAGRAFTISRAFLEDLDGHNMQKRIANLDRPLIIFHSPVDATVGIENAERIYTAAKHPKSFVSLHEADHLVTDPKTAAYLGHILSAWSQLYLT
jgi:putative redox protein